MAEEANPELETFRKQWQEEVTARSKISSFTKQNGRSYGPLKREVENNESHQNTIPSASIRLNQFEEGSFDGAGGDGYHDLEDKDIRRRLGEAGEGVHPSNENDREPSSALEHYEKAVERESQGNLGDSLKLYRKAYRVRMLLKSGNELFANKIIRWTLALIGSTKINTSHPHPPNRNRPTPTPPTRRSRSQTLPKTP